MAWLNLKSVTVHCMVVRFHSSSLPLREGVEGATFIEAFPHPALEVVLIHDAVSVQREEVVLRCADLYELTFRAAIVFRRGRFHSGCPRLPGGVDRGAAPLHLLVGRPLTSGVGVLLPLGPVQCRVQACRAHAPGWIEEEGAISIGPICATCSNMVLSHEQTIVAVDEHEPLPSRRHGCGDGIEEILRFFEQLPSDIRDPPPPPRLPRSRKRRYVHTPSPYRWALASHSWTKV